LEGTHGNRIGRRLTDADFDRLWREQFESFAIRQTDGNYKVKIDFAHMMYTSAGGCATRNTPGAVNYYPLPFGNLWKDAETRRQYIGWLGDATYIDPDTGRISFGPDDYTADLDADNIRRRMTNNNISFMQASSEYYTVLESNPLQRTQEFK
jgi:hypothetical protein